MHSDYLVFVDESGDHSLTSIDDAYPLFVLCFCIIKKSDYVNTLVPRIKTLKIETFGHDCVVLHEADIRRKRGAFSMLNKEPREAFLETLTTIIEDLPMTVVAVVIDKRKLNEKYSTPYNPYHLGTQYGLERVWQFEIVINDKKANTEGLQICDLMAGPIGLSVLRPEQGNRAFAVLQGKFFSGASDAIEGNGLKIVP